MIVNNIGLHCDDKQFTPHRFSHQAMATIYEIFILHDNRRYAEQAAHEAFRELDKLEQDLSRFVENSDISRINKLGHTQPVRVGTDAFSCLAACTELCRETRGAFDPTIGPLLKCWLDENKAPRTPSDDEIRNAMSLIGMDTIILDPDNFTVSVRTMGVALDLGGYGKGYAVDCLAALLGEWDLKYVLIHGGMSSVLACDHPGEDGWHVTISNPARQEEILSHFYLRNEAINGSGVQKGRHIIDPRTGYPAKGRMAAWVCTGRAAEGDALSTAFMILPEEEIAEFCSRHDDIGVILLNVSVDGHESVTVHGNAELRNA